MNRVIKYLVDTCDIDENTAKTMFTEIKRLERVVNGEYMFHYYAHDTEYENEVLTDKEYEDIQSEFDIITFNRDDEQEIQAIDRVTGINFSEVEKEF